MPPVAVTHCWFPERAGLNPAAVGPERLAAIPETGLHTGDNVPFTCLADSFCLLSNFLKDGILKLFS